MMPTTIITSELHAAFGARLQENVSLAPYTSARIGGPADLMIIARNADELAHTAQMLWDLNAPFIILGGGSNVLVSDKGVREIVVLNKAKGVKFNPADQPTVWAESGAVFSNVAHRAAAQGLSGIEWAATVPGTIGGAVYGNAGAFGGDIAHDLISTDVLEQNAGRATWPVEKFEYGYRTSVLKHTDKRVIILSALIRLNNSVREIVQSKMDEYTQTRKRTQPPGASMGSMFKNPVGDYAGRFIEAAGLKGARVGNAEISRVHGNFFINTGDTKASDIKALIDLACNTVAQKFNVTLELEIELIGEWNE